MISPDVSPAPATARLSYKPSKLQTGEKTSQVLPLPQGDRVATGSSPPPACLSFPLRWLGVAADGWRVHERALGCSGRNLGAKLINSACSFPRLDAVQQLPWKHGGNALITSFASPFQV